MTIIFQHEESDAVHGDLIDDKSLSQGYCCGWSYYLSLIACTALDYFIKAVNEYFE